MKNEALCIFMLHMLLCSNSVTFIQVQHSVGSQFAAQSATHQTWPAPSDCSKVAFSGVPQAHTKLHTRNFDFPSALEHSGPNQMACQIVGGDPVSCRKP